MPDKEYLTPSELEIEARAKAATPGPWTYSISGDIGTKAEAKLIVRRHPIGLSVPPRWIPNHADSVFIMRARADIPALLATLRAERAKREELEREIERIKKHEREKWEAVPLEFRRGNPEPYETPDPHDPDPDGPQGGC